MVRRSLFSRLFSRFTGGGRGADSDDRPILGAQPMVATAGVGGAPARFEASERAPASTPTRVAMSSLTGVESNGATRKEASASGSATAPTSPLTPASGSGAATPPSSAPAAADSATKDAPAKDAPASDLAAKGPMSSTPSVTKEPPRSAPEPVRPLTVEVEPVVEPPEPPVDAGRSRKDKAKDVKSSRMGAQEELSLKITDGLSSLSGLLDRIDDKMAIQNEQTAVQQRQNEEIKAQLRALPTVLGGMAETQKASLEVVKDVRTVLQQQAASARRQADLLEKLPGAVEGVGAKIDAQNETGLGVRDSVDSVGKSVRNLADGAQRAQNTMLAEFRRAQDEHRRRLEELVDRERKTILVVSGLALLVVVCLVLILVNTTGG